MTLAEKLLNRLGRPGGQSPAYIGARCLRRRFIRSGCELCQRECPVPAIQVGPGEVRLAEQHCTGCLACAAVCPTEALVSRDERWQKIWQQIRAGELGKPPVLGCERALRTGKELLLPCLGLLGRQQLAVLALLTGSLVLQLYPCRQCHSPWVAELVRQRLDELLASWRGQWVPTIELSFEPVPVTAEQDDKAAATQAPGRREFFRAFKTVSTQAAVETWWALRDEPDRQEEQWASNKHLPAGLSLLAKAWECLAAEQRQLLLPLLTMLEIGAACTMCRACVGLCPSGAISSKEEEGESRLWFAWAKCSGCGLCREFCPARAVTLRPPADLEELATAERQLEVGGGGTE